VDTVGAASAKLLLFGEHAAVHGHAAVGTSIPGTIVVRVSGNSEEWDLGRIAVADRPTVAELLRRMEALLPAGRVIRGALHIASRVPRGAGFGSSAALCGALARALLERLPATDARPGEAWRLAHEAERLFHGTPSGIDTGLALGAGMAVFHPRAGGLPTRTPLPPRGLWLVVAAVPRDAGCGALIAGIAGRLAAGDAPTAAHIAELGRIAVTAAGLLGEPGSGVLTDTPTSAAALAGLAEEAMLHLRGLELGNGNQDALLDAGRGAGALGGKLSGGGGGGAFYLIAPDGRTAARVARRVRRASMLLSIEMPSPVQVVRL
jgi:mevalonate kinase